MPARGIDRRTFLSGVGSWAAAAGAASAAGVGLDRVDVASSGAPVSLGERRTAVGNPSLIRAARSGGRFFGAAARIDFLNAEGALSDAVVHECGQITPEIHLKWDAIERQRGSYNFEPIDRLITFAANAGQEVRGHTLIWDQSTPEWAKSEMLATGDWTVIRRHFERVLARYRNHISEWDVVNEPIDTEHGEAGLRVTTFYRAFGSSYIERALREAQALAPGARLIINEYGFDYANPVDEARRCAFLNLLERLRNSGVPLDGVGVQAHLDLAKGAFAQYPLRKFLRSIAELGLDITITELDVKEADRRASVERRDRLVADHTRRYLDIVLAEPAVRGIVTWGLSDRFSWLSDGDESSGGEINRGLPFDAGFAPKPMYWAIRDALLTAGKVS